MSVNVTVHENFYKFGKENKMISDFDYAKKQELEQRKRLRLEQVRQQSKVLAKNLRNRYEEEKRRQQKCLEQCKMKELKSWQQKNIEKLQKEYAQCLKNVGKAHKAAKDYEEDEKLQKAKQMAQRAMSIKRGLHAAERLRREQEAKKKKRSINRLKQKTVSVQTEYGPTESESEASQVLENVTISSDEEIDVRNKDYINPNKPYNAYKSNATKTILSSSDDDEEIKILSDMTSEENERKRFETDRLQKRQPQSIDPNYDRPLSDYKSLYSGTNRPFNQVSDYLKKRIDEVTTSRRPVLAELGNHSVLDSARTLIDKEKLSSLYKSPKKIAPGAGTQFQPSVQRVSNVIDRERRKSQSSNVIPAKRPPKAIPNEIRADAAIEKERRKQEFQELTSKLDKFCAEEKHLKAYDIPEYNYSTVKLLKDAEARQQRLEKAFEHVVHQPTIITCPKVGNVSRKPPSSRSGPTINVADFYQGNAKTNISKTKQKKSLPVKDDDQKSLAPPVAEGDLKQLKTDFENKSSQRIAELDRIVNMERLKDLLQKMNEQKELLLHEIEKDQTVPDLTRYKEAIELLEIQKARLLNEKHELVEKPKKDVQANTSNVEVKNGFHPEKEKFEMKKIELEKRERQLQILEQRLENEMKKLYKKTKEVEQDSAAKTREKFKKGPVEVVTEGKEKVEVIEETSTTSTSTSSTSETDNENIYSKLPPPVKIIIKVNDYLKKSDTAKQKLSKKIPQTLSDKTGKLYPKTPAKKSILKQPTNAQKEEPSVIIIDDDTIEEVPPIPKEDARKSPEISGESGSTIYRDPPAKMKTEFEEFLNRIAKQKFESQKKTQAEPSTAQSKEKPSKQHSAPSTKPIVKPSQSDNKKRELNPALTYYIQRLLGMSRASIDQLGISSGSDIPTPNSSVINIPSNIGDQSQEILERMEKLKSFIEENNSFISEVDETLSRKQLNGTIEENASVVENIWQDTLKKKEEEIRKKQTITQKQAKKVGVVPQKQKISRPCKEPPIQPKPKKIAEKSKVLVEPPKQRTSRLCNQGEPSYQSSTLSSATRSKSASPRKQRQQSKPRSTDAQQKDRRARSVSPPTRSLGSPMTASTGSPNQPKSILKSPRKQMASNINKMLGELERLRVTGKDEDKVLDIYAELTENCSKRISELAKFIEQTRTDKKMLMELSYTSNDQPNSTEYMDLPAISQNRSTEDGHTSPETFTSPPDQHSNKRMTQMQQIGKSRDSGISMSRPVTSSDFRGSTEQVSPEPAFESSTLLKGVPYLRDTDKGGDQAEKLHSELRKFGSYLNDLDASMTKLTSGMQKQKSKPPSAIKRYSPQLIEKTQPHELSTIVEAETSAASKLNVSQDKQLPLIDETDLSKVLKPEDFPTYDSYLAARVHQFTQDGSDVLKNVLHSSTNSDKLNYEKFPSLQDEIELSLMLKSVQKQSEKSQEDLFEDLSDELRRRKIIDHSLKNIETEGSDGSSSSNTSDILDIKYEITKTVKNLQPVKFTDKHKTPEMEESVKNPVSPRKLKQFEARVVQKTPTKHTEGTEELDSTVPKTPEKPKVTPKKRVPRHESSPRRKKATSNLSGFTYLQESMDGKKLQKDLNEMGLHWAASTIKRTEQAQALPNSSTSDSSPLMLSEQQEPSSKKMEIISSSDTSNSSKNKEPTKPLGLREFLKRELIIHSRHGDSSTESSLSSLLLQSLMNMSSSTSNTGNENGTMKRTSTPLQGRSASSSKSSVRDKSWNPPASDAFFSGDSRLSSVHENESDVGKTPLQPPNIKTAAEKYASSSATHSDA